VIDRTLTQSELLTMWERGEGQRPSRRALALLSGAAPDTDVDELAEVPVGRRDAALLALREQLFGKAFTGVTSCPACGAEIELAFGADEVRHDEAGESSSVRVVEQEYEIEARLPSTADLSVIESMDDVNAARAQLFARCIVRSTRDGESIEPSGLPDAIVDLVAARMASLDPQADAQIQARCPSCAHAWREPFDIVTFLFTELAVFARRLLADVHDLACAYGWSEREILALSPARRNAYLEMLR